MFFKKDKTTSNFSNRNIFTWLSAFNLGIVFSKSGILHSKALDKLPQEVPKSRAFSGRSFGRPHDQ